MGQGGPLVAPMGARAMPWMARCLGMAAMAAAPSKLSTLPHGLTDVRAVPEQVLPVTHIVATETAVGGLLRPALKDPIPLHRPP